jgi:anti-sigma regulatory factor (Ser/Thr protein kinase)
MSSNAPARRSIKQTIRELLDRRPSVRASDVLAELDHTVSRQAVHQQLQAMAAAGEIERIGPGRASAYRRAVLASFAFETAGLDESAVWSGLLRDVAVLRKLPDLARSALGYVCTEIINNAIDHSGSPTVTLRVDTDGPSVVVDVDDAGVGIFRKIADALGDASPLEAAQRLTLGKFTTWPERHTGEGIFFSSRAVDSFLIEANGLRWTVDNVRDDWAIGSVGDRVGTLVRFTLDPATARPLVDVFRQYTDGDHRFDRTRVVVKLLETGVTFVSRSEAKRVLAGLEPFDHIVLDFKGVSEVGQGFVDELFRVWAAARPTKTLEPVNMSEAVRFMVERGLPKP